MKPYLEDFLDILIPRHCAGCSRLLVKGEPEICTGCRSKIQVSDSFSRPTDNELMDRLKGRILLSHAFYYTWFRKGGVMQSVLHGLKYADRQEAGILLGNWMGHELRKKMHHLDFDFIVPVPMHAAKLRQRGYNQSALLAHGISEVTEIPVAAMLQRSESGTTQTRLGRWQRWVNSSSVYTIGAQSYPGTRVLVVDDVITTGATIEACVSQLYQNEIAAASIISAAISI